MTMRRNLYPTDITDEEWAILEPLIPPPKPGGRPRTTNIREVINAIFYVLRGGIQWRMLPADFPPWQTVYHYFRCWRMEGIWEKMNTALRERTRIKAGRQYIPSAGILDSQSVKTTERGGTRGYDGGKKIKGRKRHLFVDTQGLLLKVKIHPADVHDKELAMWFLPPLKSIYPRMKKIWVDSAYRGIKEWLKKKLGWELEVVKHWWTGIRGFWCPSGVEPPSIPRGFHVLPRRWVVERTLAWLSRNRRLAKDYEFLPETGGAFCYAGMVRLMLRRLA